MPINNSVDNGYHLTSRSDSSKMDKNEEDEPESE